MKALGIFIVLCISWGTTWVAIRLGVTNAPPVLFAGSRFMVAGLILLGYVLVRHGTLSRQLLRDKFLYLTSLMIIAATFGLIFWGEQYVSSGLAAVIVQGLIPVSLPLFAVLAKREKMTLKSAVVVALGVVGLFVAFSERVQYGHRAEAWGVLALIVGTLIYCWGSIIGKYRLAPPSVVELSGLQNFIGGVALVLAGLVLERNKLQSLDFATNPVVVWSWLHLVFVGSIVGFTAYLFVLKQWGSIKAASYAFVTPVIALLIDAGFFSAQFTNSEQLGCAIILVTVVLTFVPWKPTASRQGKGELVR